MSSYTFERYSLEMQEGILHYVMFILIERLGFISLFQKAVCWRKKITPNRSIICFGESWPRFAGISHARYHIGRLSYSQAICMHVVQMSAEYEFVELTLSLAEDPAPLLFALALVPKYLPILLSQH